MQLVKSLESSASDKLKDIQDKLDTINCLKRLLNNRDFKKVILEGYLNDCVVSTVLGLSNTEVSVKDNAYDSLMGASKLNLYLTELLESENSLKRNLDYLRNNDQ